MTNNNDVRTIIDMNLRLKLISYLEIERADLKKAVDKYYLCDNLLKELVPLEAM